MIWAILVSITVLWAILVGMAIWIGSLEDRIKKLERKP